MSKQVLLENISHVLSLLKDNETKIKINALKILDKYLHMYWHEIANHLTDIESLYEDEHFPERGLASAIASKVFYNLEEYDEAVNYALRSGPYFDITASKRDQYTETMIGKCIDRYIALRQKSYEAGESTGVEIDKKLEEIFDKCLKDSDFKLAIGIAVDSRRIDKIKEILRVSGYASEALNYLTKLAQTSVGSRKFRLQVLQIIVEAYKSTEKQMNDYLNVAYCLFLLDDSISLTKMLYDLIKTNEEDKECLAYQIASDINENDNRNFIDKVLKDLSREEGNTEIEEKREKLTKILKGKFREEVSLNFYKANNQADPLILSNMKGAIDQKNSIGHGGVITANGFMNAYSTNDSFLRNNLEWVAKATHWGKFSATASLGNIHRTNYSKAKEILAPYFPGSSPNPQYYTHGGALYALGMIHTGDRNQDTIRDLTNAIKDQQHQGNEVLIHGACLGLGLTCMGMGDEEYQTVYEDLKNILETDSATTGEAAGLAIGLLMLGSANQQVIQDLLTQAHDSQHEKIIRSCALALGLIMYGKEESADLLIEQLLDDKDPILRFGAMFMIGLAYVGTANNEALKKLLHSAVSDVHDDVRRAAVTNIGFLMLKNPTQVPKIVNLLSGSFNPHVRYGSTLALGIACAGSANPEAISLLEPMLNDSIDFVRQGAYISMAMVLQQVTQTQEPKIEKFRTQLNEIITKKHEDPLARLGAILATGIIDAGGRNSLITLLTQNAFGYPKIAACAGMAIFVNFWYWFPLTHFLSLTLSPACLIGVTKELKVPKSFQFKSNAKPSLFEYPAHLKPSDKKQETKVQTVSLSITAKAKARAQKKAGEKEAMEIEGGKKEGKESEEKKMEIEEPEKKKEEPAFKICSNPSRVLPKQQDFIAFLDDNRYLPLLRNRKRGIIFIKDTKTGDQEEYFTGEIPIQVEPHLVPPEAFIFDEEAQKKATN